MHQQRLSGSAARHFEKNLVAPGKDATIEHAQLAVGIDMILLGSVKDTEFDKFVALPSDVGRCTITLYIVVDDPDTHCARALNAGAKIMRGLTDQDYGGRDLSCLDIGGHIWTFGTHDPWEAK